MEGQLVKNDEVEEEISDSFLCCVCLELLYKPIVLSCGHISCFWCVHNSMNGLRESRCPICRDPYLHFPSICHKLHFLLRKMYPIAYKNREAQILMEEQEKGCFSPQIDAEVEELEDGGKSGGESISLDISKAEKVEAAKTSTVEANTTGNNHNGKSEQISTAGLLCEACNQLLFHPVVLNCGHVYCEACVVNPINENEKIECQVCQVLDPRGFPKVCLVLDHLLKEIFPKEYESRRTGVEIRQNSKSTTSGSENAGKNGLSSFSADGLPWSGLPSNVHFGAGCDSCGIYPIIGNRYKCIDCTEDIGYDLCGECYNTRSKLPGRFNQQHTSEHRLQLVNVPRNLRLVTRLLEDGTNALVILNEGSEASEEDSITGEFTFDDVVAEDQVAALSGHQNVDETQPGHENGTQSG